MIIYPRQIAGLRSFTRSNLQGVVRLLMDACQQSGVTGVVADGIEKGVHTDECHGEAVAVERVLEGVEGMVEFIDAKIIYADLVSDAGAGRGGVRRAGVFARQ